MTTDSKTVSFTAMENGTREDYEFLSGLEEGEMSGFSDRVLGWLRTMDAASAGR